MNNTIENQLKYYADGIKRGAYLYHYTDLCSTIKILIYNTLLFGELYHMNDLQESTRLVFGNDGCREAVRKYRQISLTSDYRRAGCKEPRKGFDILPMWAHYADKGTGVCLMLDANLIKKACEEQGGSFGVVSYNRKYDNAICFDTDDPDKELQTKRMLNKVFFRKSTEWSYEQEFRIVKRFDSDSKKGFLSLYDAVKGVIIAQNSFGNSSLEGQNPAQSEAYRILNLIMGDIPIFLYGADGGERSLNYCICEEFGTTDYVWKMGKTGEDYYSSNKKCELVKDW